MFAKLIFAGNIPVIGIPVYCGYGSTPGKDCYTGNIPGGNCIAGNYPCYYTGSIPIRDDD